MKTTGREMHLVKQIGEYLVCAELGRRGYIATSFTGNVPEFDILAIDKERKVQPIQVKAIKQGQWQFNASHFTDITLTTDGRQIVGEKKHLPNPDLICVFVKVVAQGQDEFYIFRLERCRRTLQARADELISTANELFAQPNHVDFTLVSV